MEIKDQIKNVHLLADIFGHFPSFHDAEVLKIILERSRKIQERSLTAVIHVFEMKNKTDSSGRYVLDEHTEVTIKFDEIAGLKLYGFNHQNVINELAIKPFSPHGSDGPKFQVEFQYCHGVSGEFRCRTITIMDALPHETEDD